MAGMSGVGVGVRAGRAASTAALKVAGMSGVAVGGAPTSQAAIASPATNAANRRKQPAPNFIMRPFITPFIYE